MSSASKEPLSILLLLFVTFGFFILGVEVNDSPNLPRQKVSVP